VAMVVPPKYQIVAMKNINMNLMNVHCKNVFCPQVSRPTITCNLKLEMKLKTLKSEIRRKINSHMK
jgi:hypothetical protein